jgi:hypothetical protein
MKRVHALRGPDGRRALLVLGITGLSSDAYVAQEAITRGPVGRVLLGVPFEDLDSIRATSGKELETEFEAGGLDDEYLEGLKRFGAVQTPPPDLYVAYRFAEQAKVPVEAIDLGDEAYTEAYTKNVGFFEVLRSNRRQRRLSAADVEAPDADAFVIAWDERLNAGRGLGKVQAAREDAMTRAIEAASKDGGVLAFVPLVRGAGIVQRLVRSGWSEE